MLLKCRQKCNSEDPDQTAPLVSEEGKHDAPEKATLAVERTQGLFGTIQVTWSVLPGDGVDLTPTTGFLTFNSNQDIDFISLDSVPDEVLELHRLTNEL